MATYVGKWDCPACGTKRIPGWENGRTVERCPACGGPCTKKWYLDDRSMVLADPQEVAKAKSKRSWTCGHCSSVNDADDDVCDACGNPRDDSSDDKITQSKLYKPGEVPSSEKEVEAVKETELGGEYDNAAEDQKGDLPWKCNRCGTENRSYHANCRNCDLPQKVNQAYADDPQKAKWRKQGKSRSKVKIVLFTILGLILFGLLGLIPKSVEVKVTGFAWERHLSIEDYAQRSRSSWDYPPSGAYNISSREEVHHYDKVYSHTDCHTETYVCGTRDNGNGTFSDEYCTEETCTDVYDDVPVYATRYYYDIMDWEHHHYVDSQGDDQKPYWPTDEKVNSNPGTWRNGSRKETYYTKVMEPGGSEKSREMEFKEWESTAVGDAKTGKKAWLWGLWYGFD